MKLRSGFVSNSSSSSFCAYGRSIDFCKFKKITKKCLLKKIPEINEFIKDNENSDSYYYDFAYDIFDLVIKYCKENYNLEMDYAIPDDGESILIGREYNSMKDEETHAEFKQSVENIFKEVFGFNEKESKGYYIEEVWRDG